MTLYTKKHNQNLGFKRVIDIFRLVERIDAASFLKYFRNFNSKSQDFFKVFDLFSNSIDEMIKYDVIIMVNWIHAFDSSLLAPKINNFINNNMCSGGLIIFDIVHEKTIQTFSGKTFHHKVADLINENCFEIKILSGYRFGRSIIIAKLI